MNSDSLTRSLDLSIAERIQLVEDIWDSIAAEQTQIPLTAAQESELEERLADAARHPGVGTDWAELKTRLLGTR